MLRRLLTVAVIAAAFAQLTPPASAHVLPKDFGRVTRVFWVRNHAAPALGSISGCPSAVTCATYRIGRARWPLNDSGGAVMNWKYSDSGRPDSAPIALGSVRSATATWNNANPSTVFSEAGTTTARPGAASSEGLCDDGVNAIGWAPLGSGAAGVTYICYDRRTLKIVDVDTALNSDLRWDNLSASSATTNQFDERAILTHELGHWLSLLDLNSSRARSQTMFASAGPGEINKRTLAAGDIAGSQAAYACGSSCPAITPSAD